jgi:hypothetical protein
VPRSAHLADMTTAGLHDERAACLRLIDIRYDMCSEPVIEYHADYADRISDELDRRNNISAPTAPISPEPDDENDDPHEECSGIHRSSDGYRDCDGNPI